MGISPIISTLYSIIYESGYFKSPRFQEIIERRIMNFDEIDLGSLPPNAEDAFIEFEKQLSETLEAGIRLDSNNYDQNGDYCGFHEPERLYATRIIAFLDEFNLDCDISDISKLSDSAFIENFKPFRSRVHYVTTRFLLRKNRINSGAAGTIISIAYAYKSEIGSLLETIRKIVNQEIKDVKKRDKIFSKIASLQSEVDREQTTIDALFGHMIELSKTVGECADHLDPLIDKLERLKKLLWDNTSKVDLLPTTVRPKLITKEDDAPSDTDDEIPF